MNRFTAKILGHFFVLGLVLNLLAFNAFAVSDRCTDALKSNPRITQGLKDQLSCATNTTLDISIILATPVTTFANSNYSGNEFAFSNKVFKEFKKLLALQNIEILSEDAALSNFRALRLRGSAANLKRLVVFNYVAWAGLVLNQRALENLRTQLDQEEISFEPTAENISITKKRLARYLERVEGVNGTGLGVNGIVVNVSSRNHDLADNIPTIVDGHSVTVRIVGDVVAQPVLPPVMQIGPTIPRPVTNEPAPTSGPATDCLQAASELCKSLFGSPGFISVGAGENEILVYVQTQKAAENLPKEYKGYPVRAIITGSVQPAITQPATAPTVPTSLSSFVLTPSIPQEPLRKFDVKSQRLLITSTQENFTGIAKLAPESEFAFNQQLVTLPLVMIHKIAANIITFTASREDLLKLAAFEQVVSIELSKKTQ